MMIEREIEGWLRPKEAKVLQAFAKKQQKRSKLDLLEIGSWKGKSGITIASVLEKGRRLWMIDHFRGSPESQYPGKKVPHGKYLRNGKLWAYPELLENIIKFRVQNNVVILPLSSEQAAQVVDEQFCLIFIDGDHSYDGVSTDWQLWSPHLEEGGVVIFHDAQSGPIKKFCNELGKRKNLKLERDGLMVIFERLGKK